MTKMHKVHDHLGPIPPRNKDQQGYSGTANVRSFEKHKEKLANGTSYDIWSFLRQLVREYGYLRYSGSFIEEVISLATSKDSDDRKRLAIRGLFEKEAARQKAQPALQIGEALEQPGDATKVAPSLTLPKPGEFALYRDRPLIPGSKRQILATEHLRNTWQKYIDAGILTGEVLRRLDPDLVRALYNQEHHEAARKGATWKVRDLFSVRTTRVADEDAALDSAGLDKTSLLRYAYRQRMRQARAPDPSTPQP